MAPPLPESTLVIAPKKGTKKKKRPAFRPGQRASKAAAARKKVAPEKPNETTLSDQKKQARLEEKDEENLPLEEKKTEADDNYAEESSLETKANSKSKEDGKEAAVSTTAAAKPADKPRLPSALKKPKLSASKSNHSKASSIQAKPSSPIRITRAGSTKAATAKQKAHSAIQPRASTEKPKATAAKSTKPGRKRKSTGLVIGATRTSASRQKKNAHQDPPPEEEKTGEAAPATPPPPQAIAPAPAGAALLPLNLPPPKEGEATLARYCSKFKSKPHHPPDPPAKKTKNKSHNKQNHREKIPQVEEAGPVVQIIDGEIVLQESSMVVEEGGGASMKRAGSNNFVDEEYTVVEEDADLTIVGADYNSFTNRTKPQVWTPDETKLFYEALRQVGTDFMLMSEFFKNRNRKQLKRKYQKELTSNPKLVDKALHPDQQKPLDLSVFEITENQVEEQKEASKQREIDEKEAKARAEAEAKSKKEDAEKSKENAMEVVIEDEDDDEELYDWGQKPTAKAKPKSAFEQQMEALLPTPAEPLWPDEADDAAVEEDPMMMEDYHHHFDDGGEETAAEGKAKPVAPAEEDQPALSLLPSANKKKKKPKFKTARPGRKKK